MVNELNILEKDIKDRIKKLKTGRKRLKIAIAVGDGIGNQVEMLPAIKAIAARHANDDIRIIDTIPNNHFFTEYLFRQKFGEILRDGLGGTVDLVYNMPYTTPLPGKSGNLPIPEGLERYSVSEVKVNLMSVLGKDGPFPSDLYDAAEFFPVEKDRGDGVYDVVMHQGHSHHNEGLWEVKKVHNFHHIAEYLAAKRLKIAVIGSKNEHIGIGDDRTGLPIENTIGLIRRCGVYIGNDTGTYHIAAALRKPGFVFFTATSEVKNRDPVFHRTIEVVRRVLPCAPCQKNGNGYWMRNCSRDQDCRKALRHDVFEAISKAVDAHRPPPAP